MWRYARDSHVPEAVSVFVGEERLINNVKIDGFNLYYRALKDTPPRPGSTTRADWLSLPLSSPGRGYQLSNRHKNVRFSWTVDLDILGVE